MDPYLRPLLALFLLLLLLFSPLSRLRQPLLRSDVVLLVLRLAVTTRAAPDAVRVATAAATEPVRAGWIGSKRV